MRSGAATCMLLVFMATTTADSLMSHWLDGFNLFAQAEATGDGWLGPIIGNATAATILGAVVIYLAPKAITAWQMQQDKLTAAFFGDDKNPGAIGRLTSEMAKERDQCASQFERLMGAVSSQQEMMRQMMATNAQMVERMTRVEGLFVQARHVSIASSDHSHEKGSDR